MKLCSPSFDDYASVRHATFGLQNSALLPALWPANFQKSSDASMARGGAILSTSAYLLRSYLAPRNRIVLPSLALLPAIDLL